MVPVPAARAMVRVRAVIFLPVSRAAEHASIVQVPVLPALMSLRAVILMLIALLRGPDVRAVA